MAEYDIDIAEIQKLIESDPEKALVVSCLGKMLYRTFAAHQPKRFKAFVDALFGDGPMPIGVQAVLVHHSDWVAGCCDDLEGEGSLSPEQLRPFTSGIARATFGYC